MLTEHEQLADHEARISRQELPPLQQPLDNIEEIKRNLNDMHNSINSDLVALSVLSECMRFTNKAFHGNGKAIKYQIAVADAYGIADEFMAVMQRRKND